MRHDLDVVLGAILTLLGLIIGFSFSMAINRYDQRKTYEEDEANAIGTEYVRAGLLSEPEATELRASLREYLDQRILFYVTRDDDELQRINAKTAQIQTQLWSVVQAKSAVAPNPIVGLVVSGMNDVLNSQGYTQAEWWNRIPAAAWLLMAVIAICANLMFGYGARRKKSGIIHTLVLPLVLSIAFFLVADIDSPRRGMIRVKPQNLISLSHSLQAG